MKSRILFALTVVVVTFGLVALPSESAAWVGARSGYYAPAPMVFTAPPPFVLVPGTYVYHVPNIAADIFYYRGQWYFSAGFRGPWTYIKAARVPYAILHLPSFYHYHRHWKAWDRDHFRR